MSPDPRRSAHNTPVSASSPKGWPWDASRALILQSVKIVQIGVARLRQKRYRTQSTKDGGACARVRKLTHLQLKTPYAISALTTCSRHNFRAAFTGRRPQPPQPPHPRPESRVGSTSTTYPHHHRLHRLPRDRRDGLPPCRLAGGGEVLVLAAGARAWAQPSSTESQ